MSKEEILKIIQEQFINQLWVESTGNSLTLELAGADDLDCLEFIIAMEGRFDFTISDEDAFCRKTISEMVDYIFDEINYHGFQKK